MKLPILKRYKMSTEKFESMSPLSKFLVNELAFGSEDGQRMIRMNGEDAIEIRVIMNPEECTKMLELEEMRDDEI